MRHPLGTDSVGRDMAVRLLWGGRVSLSVGLVSAFLLVLIGTIVGAIAGYFGGWIDMLISRVIEIVPERRYNATCYPKKSQFLGLHHQQLFAECARHKQMLQVSLDDVGTALSEAETCAQQAEPEVELVLSKAG